MRGEQMRVHTEVIRIGFIHSAGSSEVIFYLSEFLKRSLTKSTVEFVCFSISDIDFSLMTVAGTIIDLNGISEKETVLPKVIFNFSYHTKHDNIKAMRRLRTTEGYRVINPTNRFNQAVILDIVRAFPQSNQFLRPFCSLSKEKITRQLQNTNILYIFPERSVSAQNTICAEKTTDNRIKVSVGINAFFCAEDELYDDLLKMTMGKKYLSMEGIALLRRNGLPLETRVYVHKNQKGIWKPGSAIARNDFFSYGSIYQNSFEDLSCTLFEEAPQKADKIMLGIYDLAVTLCSYLDYYIIDTASVTLDFVISDNGIPYLFLFGGCEQHLEALNDDDKQTYYFNIFKYMLYVSGKK